MSRVRRLYARALAGEPMCVRGSGGRLAQLGVQRWLGGREVADRNGDEALLGWCAGPVLDVGCGPGRFVAALVARGIEVLGVDRSSDAVEFARRQQRPVRRADLFDPLPGEGTWRTVLLADGNIGIGGDPLRVLRRARELVAPDGHVVVEVATSGTGVRRRSLRLETPPGPGGTPAVGEWFAWAQVAADAVIGLVEQTGLAVVDELSCHGRHLVRCARA